MSVQHSGTTAPARQMPAGERAVRLLLVASLSPLLIYLVNGLDGPVNAVATRIGGSLGGDVRRELETWQQFGGLGSLLFTAAVVWLVDSTGRRRLWRLAGSAALGSVMCLLAKNAIGRPRPKFGDAETFLWVAGKYPIAVERGHDAAEPAYRLLHAWEAPGAVLWSMPSSHTALAVVLALYLGRSYPSLRMLGAVMVGVVGTARLLVGAHWMTDVLAGATIGWLATELTECLVSRSGGAAGASGGS